jgi:LPS export ABC transporter permease LptG/LPS export ABC transporter permease LptF
MRIIRRYLIREMLPPTLISLLIFTFVMVMDVIFDIAELALKRNLGLVLVAKLFLLNLPHIIVLTIPMSVLLGIIVAFSRLSADSEIIAFRSAGISLQRLLGPTLVFATGAFLITLYLMVFFLPWGNRTLLGLEEEIFSLALSSSVEPRTFYEEFANKVIYFNDYTENGHDWQGVLLAESSIGDGRKIINAQQAQLRYDDQTDRLWLKLFDGTVNASDAKNPDKYQFSRFSEMRVLLKDGLLRENRLKTRRDQVHDPKLRAKTIGELLQVARESDIPELQSRRNLAWINIHKKFSIPFSCLVLAVIGISLGISNSRGGKSSGFAMAIGVIIIYWILIDTGEAMSIQEKMPPILGMWLPNLLLGSAGLLLLNLRSRNINFDLSATVLKFWQWLVGRFSRRPLPLAGTDGHGTAEGVTPAGQLPLPSRGLDVRRYTSRRLHIPFPNLLDRYILSQYLRVFLMVFIGFLSLFVIVDFFQVFDHIVKNDIPLKIVLGYYQFYLPQIVFFVLLLINLVSTLVTFGIFSKHNEITAIKAGGISLYRISLSVIMVAAFTSVFNFYLEEKILPASNAEYNRLREVIKGQPVSSHYRIRKWMFGEDGNRIYNYENINFDRQIIAGLSVFEFSAEDFSLKRWTYARHAKYVDGAWEMNNGWSKSFARGVEMSYQDFKRRSFPFHEPPLYFKKEWKETEQMDWSELRDYIEELKTSGYQVEQELLVDLHSKLAMPLVPLVMVLLGISFAFKMGKRGSLYGIGISISLGILYWICIAFCQQLGDLGALPPLLAAWAPNIFFGISGGYMVLTLRT